MINKIYIWIISLLIDFLDRGNKKKIINFFKLKLDKQKITVIDIGAHKGETIDLFIVLILSVFLYPIGILLALAYISICDYIQSGQSVGKKFIGMAVVSLDDGMPCTIRQSVIRNLPISVPLLFGIIPFWGWLFTVFIGIPVIFFEVYLLFKLDSGNRMGDVMADTTVMAKDQGEQITKKSNWRSYLYFNYFCSESESSF